MRTAKCITILLVVVLACAVTTDVPAGQGNVPRQASDSRTADCLLRITADPGIITLNKETVGSLLYGSSVLGKAVREVLGPDAPQDLRTLLAVEWLAESVYGGRAALSKPSPQGGYDDVVLRLENRRREEMTMMGVRPKTPERKGDSAEDSPADGRSAPGQQSERNSPRSDTGPYSGFGGGMGAYGGTPGRGGGMIGGMGGYGDTSGQPSPYGMGGRYAGPGGPESAQALEQRVTIRLIVEVPSGAKATAQEFLRALAANLRSSLTDAYHEYLLSLRKLQTHAKSQREEAQRRLGLVEADGEASVKDQLDTIVDLSAWSPETPFGAAFEILRNSVAPPLQIVAMWRNLYEAAYIEPSSPIEIDGMPSVRLGTALDILLRSMSPLPSDSRIAYRIQDSVIVIGTPDALGMSGHLSTRPEGQSDIHALAARKNELGRTVQSLELELAGMEARRKAIQEQIARAEAEANQRLGEDTVTRELEKLVQINTQTLATLRNQVEAGRSSPVELARAEESLTRARIELAKRREELGKQLGAGRIEQFNNELSRIAIDRAEKQVQLEILRKQADDVQRQLARASAFDPEAARIRVARETLDLIDRRILELETRLATLQPPSVVVIGAN
jgi:hypothetical protein